MIERLRSHWCIAETYLVRCATKLTLRVGVQSAALPNPSSPETLQGQAPPTSNTNDARFRRFRNPQPGRVGCFHSRRQDRQFLVPESPNRQIGVLSHQPTEEGSASPESPNRGYWGALASAYRRSNPSSQKHPTIAHALGYTLPPTAWATPTCPVGGFWETRAGRVCVVGNERSSFRKNKSALHFRGGRPFSLPFCGMLPTTSVSSTDRRTGSTCV